MNKITIFFIVIIFIQSDVTSQISYRVDLGLQVGLENIIAGANFKEQDVLAAAHLPTIGFILAPGMQIKKWQFSPEIGVGYITKHLHYSNEEVVISYQPNMQWFLGAKLGYEFKSGHSIFVYANEVSRNFDVKLQDQWGPFTQEDNQGMLRFGVGYQLNLLKSAFINCKMGTGRADFADRTISNNPNFKLEAAVTLGYSF
jgi:hypothetical protein